MGGYGEALCMELSSNPNLDQIHSMGHAYELPEWATFGRSEPLVTGRLRERNRYISVERGESESVVEREMSCRYVVRISNACRKFGDSP